MVAELTEREFSKHLNTNFQLSVDDHELQLVLIEVKAYLPQENEQGGMERFSTLFKADAYLPQSLYHLSHDQMGELDLFLVPVGGDQRGYQYEAIFNYYK
jgi:hypothetical protein